MKIFINKHIKVLFSSEYNLLELDQSIIINLKNDLLIKDEVINEFYFREKNSVQNIIKELNSFRVDNTPTYKNSIIDFSVQLTSEKIFEFCKICAFFNSVSENIIIYINGDIDNFITVLFLSSLHRYLNLQISFFASFNDLKINFKNVIYKKYYNVVEANVLNRIFCPQILIGSSEKISYKYMLKICKYCKESEKYKYINKTFMKIKEEYFIIFNVNEILTGDYIILINDSPIFIYSGLFNSGVYRFFIDENIFVDIIIAECTQVDRSIILIDVFKKYFHMTYKKMIDNKNKTDYIINKMKSQFQIDNLESNFIFILLMVYRNQINRIWEILNRLKRPVIKKEIKEIKEKITGKRPIKKPALKLFSKQNESRNISKYKNIQVNNINIIENTIFENIIEISLNIKYIEAQLYEKNISLFIKNTIVKNDVNLITEKRLFLFSISIKILEKRGISYKNILDNIENLDKSVCKKFLEILPNESEQKILLKRKENEEFAKNYFDHIFNRADKKIDFDTLYLSAIEKHVFCAFLLKDTFEWLYLIFTYEQEYIFFNEILQKYELFYKILYESKELKYLFSILLATINIINNESYKGFKIKTAVSFLNYRAKTDLKIIILKEFKKKYENFTLKVDKIFDENLSVFLKNYNRKIENYFYLKKKKIYFILEKRKDIFEKSLLEKNISIQKKYDEIQKIEERLKIYFCGNLEYLYDFLKNIF